MATYIVIDNEGYIVGQGSSTEIPATHPRGTVIASGSVDLRGTKKMYVNGIVIDTGEPLIPVSVTVLQKRQALLLASDWTQLPDVPLETKAAWATYRQALRDITDQPGYPQNVIWPVAP